MKLSHLPLLLGISSVSSAEEPNRFKGYSIFPQMSDVRVGAMQILTVGHLWIDEQACPNVPTGEIVDLGQSEDMPIPVKFYQAMGGHQITTQWDVKETADGFSIMRAQKTPGFEVKTSTSANARCVEQAVAELNVALKESANFYTNCDLTLQKENLLGLPTENPINNPEAPLKGKSEFRSLGITCSN